MRPAAVYIVAAAETKDGWPLVNADGAATSMAVQRTAPTVRTPGSTRSTGEFYPARQNSSDDVPTVKGEETKKRRNEGRAPTLVTIRTIDASPAMGRRLRARQGSENKSLQDFPGFCFQARASLGPRAARARQSSAGLAFPSDLRLFASSTLPWARLSVTNMCRPPAIRSCRGIAEVRAKEC